MNIKGVELESCDAIMEIRDPDGKWVDFCSIKDEDDCHYAEQVLDGTHRQFKGTFRLRIYRGFINGVEGGTAKLV